MKIRMKQTVLWQSLAILLGFLVLSGLGWLWGRQREIHLDATMRAALLEQAVEFAKTLDPAMIQALSFTLEDYDRVEYRAIHDHMVANGEFILPMMGNDIEYLSVYSVARRADGTLVFGPENIPVELPEASPPGTIYKQPTERILRAFDSRRPFIEGPYTDEYGTFVSAYAPVIDPKNGGVLMLVGMDIKAENWQRRTADARRYPLLVTLGGYLALIGCVAAILWISRRRMAEALNIRFWIVTPVMAVMFIGMFGVFVYQDRSEREETQRHMRRHADHVAMQWNRLLFGEVQMLRSYMDALTQSSALREAWRSRNSNTLSAVAVPLYASMQQRNPISHFYLVETNRDCFMRVHRLNHQGGRIDRGTMLAAESTGKDVWGIELGAMGTFTLRYVRPLDDQGRPDGFIELGMEVGHLINMLSDDTGLEVVLAIRKEFTSRQNYEAGKKAYGFVSDWSDYPDTVVAHSTLPVIPEKLSALFQQSQVFGTGIVSRLREEGLTYDEVCIPIADYSGKPAAGLVILQNVTAETARQSGDLLRQFCLAAILMLGLFALLWSITSHVEWQLRQAFARVCERESNFRMLFDTVEDMIFISRMDGRIFYANPAAIRKTGYAEDELEHMMLLDLHAPAQRSEAEAVFSEIMKRERTTCPLPLQSKAGTLIPVDTRAWFGQWNGQECIYGISKDLTAQQEALEKFDRLFHNNPALMSVGGLDDHAITEVNRSFLQTFNLQREDVIGKTIDDLGIVADPKEIADLEREVRETGRAAPREILFRLGDGREMNVLFSGELIEQQGKKFFLNVMIDQTAHRQALEALIDANTQLELAHEQARHLAEEADRANRVKGDFLANMSHEIRTPMNGVMGMVSLLLDTELTDTQRRYAKTIQTSSELLLALLNDILDYSKIEAGRMDLEIIDFDLRNLLEEFASLLAMRAQDKGLEFICAADPETPVFLRGDPGRLRQVLMNLAGNALKFTERGEVSVRVYPQAETEHTATLRFVVKDSGIGITASQMRSLFRQFSQGDTSITRKYGGTGLGLAISKQLVGMMGGEIEVESEPDRGSEFSFTVTLGKQTIAKRDADASMELLRGARVLIVDDHATNREVLIRQFNAWGARPEEADSAVSAMQKLRTAQRACDPFAVALVDMQMPDISGADLCVLIRSDETLRAVHLIMMTSMGRRGDAARMKELGFDAYLTKPIRQSDLFDSAVGVISGHLHQADPDAEAARRELSPYGSRVLQGNVLLAEDNVTNQQVAVGVLEKLGLNVEVANNGAEALEALIAQKYDLVLMDVQMPVIDGLEATRRIRQRETPVLDPAVPIIAMTAHVMRGDQEKCLEVGMNDYVSKPLNPRTLIETLERWLPGGSTRRAAAEPPAAVEPEKPTFNEGELLERMSNNIALIRIVIDGYAQRLPGHLLQLKTALAQGDGKEVAQQAHSIRGAAANVSAERLAETALALEETARAGDSAGMAQKLEEMEKETTLLVDELEAWKKANPI